MRHPDEGTIHAWLDGALTPEEGRAIEKHVASCETCGAAVAEARGLIAGASRILTGLDHVPAGVIPAAAASAPADPSAGGVAGDVRSIGEARRGPRWWTRGGALRAAAVLLFLAGGSVVVLQQANMESPARSTPAMLDASLEERAASLGAEPAEAPPAEDASAAQASAATGSAAAGDGATTAGGSTRGAAGAAPAPATPRPPSAQRNVVTGVDTAASFIAVQPGVGRERREEAAKVATPQAAPAPASRVAGYAAADRADSTRAVQGGRVGPDSLSVVGRAGLPGAQAETAEAERRRSLAVREQAAAAPSPAPGIARRMPAEQRLQDTTLRLSELTVTGAAQPAGAELAGCYTVTLAPWIPSGTPGPRSPRIPALLQLDAQFIDVTRDGPRLVLRVPEDTTAARDSLASYWRLAGRDSLVLVWRATTPETTIRLGGTADARTGVALHDGRRASVTAERIGDRCSVR